MCINNVNIGYRHSGRASSHTVFTGFALRCLLTWCVIFDIISLQVYYYIVDSPRNEGKQFFEINLQSGEIFTKVVFDREKQGAYALEVEARDGAASARPNSNGPNSGEFFFLS